MGAALAAIADDGDGRTFQARLVGVIVAVNPCLIFHSWGSLSRKRKPPAPAGERGVWFLVFLDPTQPVAAPRYGLISTSVSKTVRTPLNVALRLFSIMIELLVTAAPAPLGRSSWDPIRAPLCCIAASFASRNQSVRRYFVTVHPRGAVLLNAIVSQKAQGER